jgi:SAM-dependent methyltransferase
VPVDDVGYISSAELLQARPRYLRELIRDMEETRYKGWRNYHGRWRRVLRMDDTRGRVVCDYGCGIGIEGLQYARAGNEVILADISDDNLALARRIFQIEGFKVGTFRITIKTPVNSLFGQFDVVHCAGVLHHIPRPKPVMEAIAKSLKKGGELRLMVYSDEAWRIACGTEPPAVVEKDVRFDMFWQRWDAVGGYADWYDPNRLIERFGEWFTIAEAEYLTEHREYLGVRMVKK